MISEMEKKIIKDISKKYKVKKVLLFGSGVDLTKESNDIDIAVEGIEPNKFFEYYGELMLNLSKPIDVIDLSETSKFVSLIKEEGISLYGWL